MANKNILLKDNSGNNIYPISLSGNTIRPDNTTVEQAISDLRGGVDTLNSQVKKMLKLLWENPTPSNAFEAQSITLSENDCDFFIVQFRVDRNIATIANTVIVKVGEGAIANMVVGSSGLQSGDQFIANRVITATTQTSITFSNAYCWYQLGSVASHIIPVRVLGVKIII